MGTNQDTSGSTDFGSNALDDAPLPSPTSQWILDGDHLSLLELIGIGGYSRVYKLRDQNNSQVFARKIMNCSQDGSSADIKKEVDAAVRLNGHDNIVSVLRHGTLRNFDLVEHYYIDMEYCALDLDCYIRRTWTESIVNEVPRSLTEDTAAKTKMWQILQITHDILDGLSFIHILYSSRSDNWKIADFGLTAEGTSKTEHLTEGGGGTDGYRAPELLAWPGDPKFTNKVDIWATGCVIYEIILRKKAFLKDRETLAQAVRSQLDGKGIELPETVDCIPDKQYWTLLSHMIQFMLEVKPAMRPAAQKLLKMLEPRGLLEPSRSWSVISGDSDGLETDTGSTIPSSPHRRPSGSMTIPIQDRLEDIESKKREGLVMAALKNFQDGQYEAVIKGLEKAYTENGSFRGRFENWEELHKMLIVSQCKVDNLTGAEASVHRVLKEGEDIEGVDGEDPIFKLVKPLISRYRDTNQLHHAITSLTEIIAFRKGRENTFVESQCALVELCLGNKDIDKAKELCQKLMPTAQIISPKLRNDLWLLMHLTYLASGDRTESDRYWEMLSNDHKGRIYFLFKLTEDYIDYIKVDRLCLITSADAMTEISKGDLDDMIPAEMAAKWRDTSDKLRDRPNLYQRLFLLRIFINFGKQVQVKRLLEKWDYIDLVDLKWDNKGLTVLMEAAWRGRDDVVRLLCDHGANVNLQSSEGRTALHWAVYGKQDGAVKILLEAKANFELKDAKGLTPHARAKDGGDKQVMKTFKHHFRKQKR